MIKVCIFNKRKDVFRFDIFKKFYDFTIVTMTFIERRYVLK